ncbi:hypothetical protein GWK08_11485 [Leptobacterium flavescens]|uniref:Uncharacterized protein n=1 Tax=Leptobacterium flavescens TaxID=472055 RepID=A0A6P0ULD1_9FLAO|nr:DUF6252 family protein [Leptobacterium flavescens]NER14065.1 hypothetical protein [Leptobacterium flavescens]
MTIKRLFLLCYLTPILLFFNSCSTDGDITQEELNTVNFLQVDVGQFKFNADRVTVNTQGTLVNIVGTNVETDRSVFLTFRMDTEDVVVLGKTEENPDGNIAGYLLNAENEGYLTNQIDGISGEIIITSYDEVNNTISGEFNFTAHNEDYIPVKLQNGVFEKVSLNRE